MFFLVHFYCVCFGSLTFYEMIPGSLKIAIVIPPFKSGKSFDNCRPISVLPSVPKIIERVEYDQTLEYLEQQRLLSELQYGFRKGYNTRLAVRMFTDNIPYEIDSV